MMPKIKICGITRLEEVKYLVEAAVDFAGFVMFFPKSKRNVCEQSVLPIMEEFHKKAPSIKLVAVTVSPTVEQVEVISKMKFDYIQIHGALDDKVYEGIDIPIIRAVNVDEKVEINLEGKDKIKILCVDGKIPGNGESFDWSLLKDFNRQNRLLMLAGGLNNTNVEKGILSVKPDIVDVSSAVEYDNLGTEKFAGKDPDKIRDFVETIRKINYIDG